MGQAAVEAAQQTASHLATEAVIAGGIAGAVTGAMGKAADLTAVALRGPELAPGRGRLGELEGDAAAQVDLLDRLYLDGDDAVAAAQDVGRLVVLPRGRIVLDKRPDFSKQISSAQMAMIGS